jgi:hypothetical protein
MVEREVRRVVKDLDPVRQREYAEDYNVVPLYEKMRGEAVRQVREILGVEIDPDDWWFHQLSWPNPADRWHLDIVIDGLDVWLNANYRLFVEHGPGDGRLRTAEDFEAAVYTRDIPLRSAQLHAEIYAREVRYEAVIGSDNPFRAFRNGINRCKCVGGPYDGRSFRLDTIQSKLNFRLEGQRIDGESYSHTAVYEQRGRKWMVYQYEFVTYQTSKWEPYG